jgi:hypothetical protein
MYSTYIIEGLVDYFGDLDYIRVFVVVVVIRVVG